MSLLTLPPEVSTHILIHLDNGDVFNLHLICKTINTLIVNNNVFWQNKIRKDFLVLTSDKVLSKYILTRDLYIHIRDSIKVFINNIETDTKPNFDTVEFFINNFDRSYLSKLSYLQVDRNKFLATWCRFVVQNIVNKATVYVEYLPDIITIVPMPITIIEQYSKLNAVLLRVFTKYPFTGQVNLGKVVAFLDNILFQIVSERFQFVISMLEFAHLFKTDYKGIIDSYPSKNYNPFSCIILICILKIGQLLKDGISINTHIRSYLQRLSGLRTTPQLVLLMVIFDKVRPELNQEILLFYLNGLSIRNEGHLCYLLGSINFSLDINVMGLYISHHFPDPLKRVITKYVEKFPESMTRENLKKVLDS